MDEGLNTFLEKETRRERYPALDQLSGTPKGIIPWMKGDKTVMRPIMASSTTRAEVSAAMGTPSRPRH